MLTHLLSHIPFIHHYWRDKLFFDLQDQFAKGHTALVFFPDQYFQTDFTHLEADLRLKDPSLQVGFMTVNNGNSYMTVFFVAKSLQLLWDCTSLYKNSLRSRWLAFHVNALMGAIRVRAINEGVSLNVKEVFRGDFAFDRDGLNTL